MKKGGVREKAAVQGSTEQRVKREPRDEKDCRFGEGGYLRTGIMIFKRLNEGGSAAPSSTATSQTDLTPSSTHSSHVTPLQSVILIELQHHLPLTSGNHICLLLPTFPGILQSCEEAAEETEM